MDARRLHPGSRRSAHPALPPILDEMATRPTEESASEASDPKSEDGHSGEAQAEKVREDLHRYIAPAVGPDDERVITDSGIEIDRIYEESDVAPDLPERLGEPGAYPFTRGIHDGMYRDRLWTMRQYAGFASPEDTNGRYRYLIEHGSTGLSMAFDLPTQLGRDSDEPLCLGEVGRTGVAIDTIEDMRICFDQIPLDEVSTSMTINAPAAILLLLYELVGEEQDVPAEKLRGTVQNDVLKEYVARGNYIYPAEATMRLTTDIFEYCRKHVPKWNTISISGYHMREKGCSAVQEVAFTLANAIAYVEAALDLPTERSARIALRTQQVIAHESGAADSADPLAGSYFIESLTDEIETRAWELIDKVQQLGGSVEALEFIQREIEESAASYHERYRTGQNTIVGVNRYVTDQVDDVEILRVDPEAEKRQVERLKRFK